MISLKYSSEFVLNRGARGEGAVPASGVVEVLDVVIDRGGELDPGSLPPAVEQLDLHAAPERLDDGVVVGRGDGA